MKQSEAASVLPGYTSSIGEDPAKKEKRKDSGREAPPESLACSMDDLRARMTDTKAKVR
jgi:hypothetical protein